MVARFFSPIFIFSLLIFLSTFPLRARSLDNNGVLALNSLFGFDLVGGAGEANLSHNLGGVGRGWQLEWVWEGERVYRKYSYGEETLLGGRVYSRSARFVNGLLEELSIVLSNKGDTPQGRASGLDVDMAIREDARALEKNLKSLLGNGEPHLDKGGGVPESGRIWRIGNLRIFLSEQTKVYARIKVFPEGIAGGRIADSLAREKNIQSVKRRDNGDVVISGIPMIDQGPKGYCVPASWARVLQFMGVEADMYVLGAASNSGKGGTDIYEAARIGVEVAKGGGRKVSFPQLQPSVREVAKYIDKGIPIIWGMLYSEEFATKGRHASGTSRHEDTPLGRRGVMGVPHMCVIIGYNETTGEIAVSDSWGQGYGEKWYDAKTVKGASLGKFYIVEY